MSNQSGFGSLGEFEGKNALYEQTGDKVDIYYNDGNPLGAGHGHVVTNGDGGVQYWREPGASEPIIDSFGS